MANNNPNPYKRREVPLEIANSLFSNPDPIPFSVLVERGLTKEEKEIHLVGAQKQRYTKSLFYEKDPENQTAIYTLFDCRPLHYRIIRGLPRYDLRQLYLGVDDITEWNFIERFLYDKDQWEKLQASKEFMAHIKEWRNEQRLRVKSEMFDVLLRDAKDVRSSTKTTSAKYLLEKYYDPTTKNEKQPRKEKEEDNRLLVADKERILSSFKVN